MREPRGFRGRGLEDEGVEGREGREKTMRERMEREKVMG